MHRATTFALGVATGTVAVTIAFLAAREGARGEPAGAPGDRPAAVPAAGGAWLEGRLPGVAPAPDDEGDADRFERWYREATKDLPHPRVARTPFWLGLVRAYAAANRHADLQRACDRALEDGVPPAELLETLRAAGRSPDLQALLARHPEAAWDLRSRLQATSARDPAPVLDALRAERERLRAQREGRPVGAPEARIVELLERLAAIDPASARAEAEALYAAAGEHAGIASQIAEGLRADPTVALGFVRRGLERAPLDERLLSLYMTYDLPAATAHLEATIARDPATVAAWDALANARSRADDLHGAALALARAAAYDPAAERLESLASLDPAMALPLIAAAAEGTGAHDPDLWALRARVELRSGSAEAALDAWIRMAALDPGYANDDDMPGWIALDPRRVATALAPLAERAFATEDADHLGAYATALVEARDPGAFAVCRRAVEKGIWWGAMPGLLARADPVAALPLLEARRAAGPPDVDLLLGLGEAYLGTQRRGEAVAAFERALAAADGGWTVGYSRIWVGLVRADPVGGLARARERADQLGGEAGAGFLGEVLAAAGRTAEARAAYDRAIELAPESALWRARRAALR